MLLSYGAINVPTAFPRKLLVINAPQPHIFGCFATALQLSHWIFMMHQMFLHDGLPRFSSWSHALTENLTEAYRIDALIKNSWHTQSHQSVFEQIDLIYSVKLLSSCCCWWHVIYEPVPAIMVMTEAPGAFATVWFISLINWLNLEWMNISWSRHHFLLHTRAMQCSSTYKRILAMLIDSEIQFWWAIYAIFLLSCPCK